MNASYQYKFGGGHVQVCPVCGKAIRQAGHGRQRIFCSNACRQKGYRRRCMPEIDQFLARVIRDRCND